MIASTSNYTWFLIDGVIKYIEHKNLLSTTLSDELSTILSPNIIVGIYGHFGGHHIAVVDVDNNLYYIAEQCSTHFQTVCDSFDAKNLGVDKNFCSVCKANCQNIRNHMRGNDIASKPIVTRVSHLRFLSTDVSAVYVDTNNLSYIHNEQNFKFSFGSNLLSHDGFISSLDSKLDENRCWIKTVRAPDGIHFYMTASWDNKDDMESAFIPNVKSCVIANVQYGHPYADLTSYLVLSIDGSLHYVARQSDSFTKLYKAKIIVNKIDIDFVVGLYGDFDNNFGSSMKIRRRSFCVDIKGSVYLFDNEGRPKKLSLQLESQTRFMKTHSAVC